MTGPVCVVRLVDATVRLGGNLVLRKLTLEVAPGERVALIGANGSGKSTLLKALHGLLPLAGGLHLLQAGTRAAMLFQRPWMWRGSARQNLLLALWLAGVRGDEARTRADAALAEVGLAAQAGQAAPELSGGQQQRLALARARVARPDLLLLDEPTANLDPHAKGEVERLLHELIGKPDAPALVFASHNLGQVKRLATRVVYLESGRVMADLPTQRLFGDPGLALSHPAAHGFLKGELA